MMARTVSVKVEGLSDLLRKMHTLSDDMQKKVAGRATGAAAQIVKKQAKQNIRSSPAVRTGSLFNSVISKKLPASQTPFTSEHIVTVRGRGKTGKTQTRAPHANFVEFGTVNMPAEPFLRPAFDRNRGRLSDAIVSVIRNAVKDANK